MTTLGIFHTALSLIAVGAGVVALARYRQISIGSRVGRLYVAATVLTCLTSFGLLSHGFGKPHVLGIITLAMLGVAALAGGGLLGRPSRYIETVAYSMTLFFHLVPGITETATRLPAGAPLASSPEAAGIQAAIGVAFLAFLIGAALQVLRLRSTPTELVGDAAAGART